MTALEVLDKVLKAGGKVIPDPPRHRVQVPVSLKPLVAEHREGLRQLIGQHASDLEAAYRAFWSLPQSAPSETFGGAYREIAALESRISPDVSWWVLRKVATAYHQETGTCPFCRERGDLHLPAAQRELELTGGAP